MNQILKENNNNLIYEIDSQQQPERQNRQNLSGTSNSDDNKKNQEQTQISQSRPIQNYISNQIIRINPSKTQNVNESQQNNCIQIINIEDEKYSNQEVEEEDIYESQGDSPVKLKRQRRKKQNTGRQQNINKDKNLIFQDNSQMKESIEIVDYQQKEASKIFKLPSQFEINDTQRTFDVKKQQRHIKKRLNDMKIQEKKQNGNINKGIMSQPKGQDSQQYQDEQNVETYNDQQQQEGMIQSSMELNKLKKKKNHKIKVLKQSPKQIQVQTTIQSLIFHQIPKNLKIACLFKLQSNFFGMSTQYNLMLKENNKTLLSAKKWHFSLTSSKFIISLNENYITQRKDNQNFVGKLEGNFSGTAYELVQRQCLNDDQNDIQYKEYSQKLILQIKFDKNLWGYQGLRNVHACKINKNKLTKRDLIKKTTLQDILQRGQLSKLTILETKKPKFDETKKKYIMDFKGKAKISSGKNIILSRTNTLQNTFKKQSTKQVSKFQKLIYQSLMIAKQSQNQYLVEISYPLSIFQAFGICLANNDFKLLVN